MDLLLHNLRTIGTHHCDQTVGEEAAQEIERLRSAAISAASWLDDDWVDVHAPAGLRVALRKLRHIVPNGEVRGASRLAGEASSAEGATSTVVLEGKGD